MSRKFTASGILLATVLAHGARGQAIDPPVDLVGWWDAERISSFDSFPGRFLLDVANPSTCHFRGAVQPATAAEVATDLDMGATRRVLLFDGDPEMQTVQIDPAGPSLFDGTAGITVEFWMKAIGQPSGPLVVIVEKSHDCGSGWVFQGDGTDLGFGIVPGVGCSLVGANSVGMDPLEKPFNTQWRHIAGVYEPLDLGAEVKFYVDGVLVDTTDAMGATIATNSRPVHVGDWWQGGRPYFGALDELSIYSRALTAGEVQAIFLAGADGKKKPAFGERMLESYKFATGGLETTSYWSAAMTDDLLVAGCPTGSPTDPGGVQSGVVSVFTRDPGMDWTYTQELAPTIPTHSAQFGSGVLIHEGAGGPEIMVGMGTGMGDNRYVWTFKHDGSAFVSDAGLQVDVGPSGWFGHFPERIARSKDADGEVLVVGMPRFERDFVTNRGAIEIYRLDQTDPMAPLWVKEADFDAPLVEADGQFGESVAAHSSAMHGDVVLVGAPGAEGGEGRTYVYEHDGSSWSLTDVDPLAMGDQGLASKPGADLSRVGDQFGRSIAMASDSGGRLLAVIGAGGVDTCDSTGQFIDRNQGAGYVFVRDAGTGAWSFEAELVGSDVESDFRMGGHFDTNFPTMSYGAVGFDGEMAVFGAWGGRDEEGFEGRFGTAYAFRRVEGEWQECARLYLTDPTVGDYFGHTLAVHGDSVVICPDHSSKWGILYAYEGVCPVDDDQPNPPRRRVGPHRPRGL